MYLWRSEIKRWRDFSEEEWSQYVLFEWEEQNPDNFNIPAPEVFIS